MLMLDQSKKWNGQSAVQIAHFERMGLNGLSSNPFNLVREQVVERKRKEQPIGACPYHTLASSLHFLSFLFFYTLHFLSYSYIPYFLPYFPLFSFLLFFSLIFPCSLLASRCSSSSCCYRSLCTAKAFLYYLP